MLFEETFRSAKEISRFLEKFREENHHFMDFDLLFRGQEKVCWKLLPSISRFINEPSYIQLLEKKRLTLFKDEMIKNRIFQIISSGKTDIETEWKFIQQAQHLGLATRFMDWTIVNKIALYFATEKEEHDSFDGVIWVYFVKPGSVKNIVNNDYLLISPSEYQETIFINSPILFSEKFKEEFGEHRKNIQRGRFFVQHYDKAVIPLEDQFEHHSFLGKIIIPSYCKKDIRSELIIEDGLLNDGIYAKETIIHDDKNEYKIIFEKTKHIVQKLNSIF